MKVNILYLVVIVFLSNGQAFERLNPHGIGLDKLEAISKSSPGECFICHQKNAKQGQVVVNVHERCTDCHNPKSHSGLIEHLGKKQQKHMPYPGKSINCLDCHRAHYIPVNLEKDIPPGESSFLYISPNLSQKAGFTDKKSPRPMLKYSCLDCHNWKDLK